MPTIEELEALPGWRYATKYRVELVSKEGYSAISILGGPWWIVTRGPMHDGLTMSITTKTPLKAGRRRSDRLV